MEQRVGLPGNPFLLALAVRDYECDMEGIVNNATYLNYLEHARHRYFSALGLTFAELTQAGIHPIVTRAEVDYRIPLRSGDRFAVSVVMERISPLRFAFLQEIRVSARETDPGIPGPQGRLTPTEFATLPLATSARIIATAITASGRPVPPEKWHPSMAEILAALEG